MRAIYTPKIESGLMHFEGDTAHHLIRVVRIQKGETILLLNGQGHKAISTVEEVSKKDLTLKVQEIVTEKLKHNLHLVLGLVKREALEEILKASVEMGLQKIYLVRTQFSQGMVENKERLHKLLVSALEQSNNTYLPELIYCENLKAIPLAQYKHLYTLSLENSSSNAAISVNDGLMFIGPEGGFSPEEEEYLKAQGAHGVHIPVPILRAKTAVIMATGYLLGKSEKRV